MKRLLKGGRVVDPANGLDGAFDVLIDGDRDRQGRARPAGGRRHGGRGAGRPGGVSRPHRHARAPARAGAGAQGDRGHRHGVGGGRRLHRRRVHAEHEPGERQRHRDVAHPRQGRRGGPGARLSDRRGVARVEGRAAGRHRRAEGRPAASPSPTTGIPMATALLLRRALEYAGMFGMPVIEHCEDPTLKGDGVAHEGFHASRSGCAAFPARARRSASSAACCWPSSPARPSTSRT